MAFKFFTIPIHNCETSEDELNAFLRSHKVITVDGRWVEQGSSSFWSFCIDYLEGVTPRSNSTSRAKVDYKEVLKPEEFAVFAKLRDLRKELAQTEAVPVYTIFTNEQLAQIVQGRIASKTDLEKVTGIGDARIEKYGARVLELLSVAWKSNDETSGKSV